MLTVTVVIKFQTARTLITNNEYAQCTFQEKVRYKPEAAVPAISDTPSRTSCKRNSEPTDRFQIIFNILIAINQKKPNHQPNVVKSVDKLSLLKILQKSN